MKRFPRPFNRLSPRLCVVMLLLLTLLSACSVTGDEERDATASPAASSTTAVDPTAPTTVANGEPTPATTESATDGTPAASPGTTPATGIGDPPVTVVLVSDVLDDAQAFIDQPVTLDADVAETVDDLAFTIIDTGTDDPLLVVGAPGVIPSDLEPGAYVRIAGVVRTFEQSEIELAIGAGLDDDAFSEFAGAPVVIANEVRIGLVSVAGLLGDPDAYVGRRITVTGPIDQIISPQAFTLESDTAGTELLVAASFRAVAPDIAADKWVRATGTVRVLDEGDDAFSNDLAFLFEDDGYAAYTDQAIVVLDLLEILSDDTTTTTAEIVANPETFGGQAVIVTSPVGSVLAAQAFTLEADGQQLLVVAREGTVPDDLTAGAVVLVSGTVDAFSATGTDAIVWQALGVNPADPTLAAFDGQPAIIADRIDLVAVAKGP